MVFEMILSEGREAEVTRDEEGFKGAWYAVTILKLPLLPDNNNDTKGKALVQYNNIVEDDGVTPFTENVLLTNIRPLRPQPETPGGGDGDHCFQVKEVVDAFHLGGWWTGSVSEVLHNPKRYIVTLPDPIEDIEFSSSNLRPHWEWVDGKWVKSSKLQESLVSSDCQEPVELSCNTTIKDDGTAFQLERSDALKCSSKKLEPCSVSSRKREMGLSVASKEPEKSNHLKRAIEGDATPLHPFKKSKDGSSANSLVPESNVKEPNVEGVWEENVDLLKKNGRLQNIDVEGQQHPAADELDTIKVEAAIEVSEVQKMTKEADSSVTRELPIESCHFVKEDINLQKEHDMTRYEKEDGAKTWINRTEQLNVVLEIQQPKSVPRISQSTSAEKDDVGGVLEEMCSEEQTATEVEPSMISRLEQAERTGELSATDCQRKIIKIAGESDRILHENEEESPLICYKELQPGVRQIQSVAMEENNQGHSPRGFANQLNGTREKSLETVVQSPLIVMADGNEPQEGQYLPFVKSLPMWKAVESMEIFQVMPQKPRFHPLVKFNEILREGLAFGYMLSFASMVQRASKLAVADPRNDFTSILDALPDFEILGFDVKAIRDRTSDLLVMKDRHEHLEGHSKEVHLQAKQYLDELIKINEEVVANYKEMRELEEKQALLLFMKESKKIELNSLQVSSDVATQGIQRVENDFESLVGSPW